MADNCDAIHGAGTVVTITYNTTDFVVAKVTGISGFSEGTPDIVRRLLLADKNMQEKYCEPQRITHEPIEMTIEFSPTDYELWSERKGAYGTIEIEFEIPGETNHVLTGDGWLSGSSFGEVTHDDDAVVEGTLSWRFAGGRPDGSDNIGFHWRPAAA